VPRLALVVLRGRLARLIDESGHPRPTDQSTRPVILAACVRESDAGRLTRALFSLRQTKLGRLQLSKDEREGKAAALLNRRSLTRVPEIREYVDSLFEWLRDFDLTVFAIVMQRPAKPLYEGPEFLNTQHRWLLERIDRFMEREHPKAMAIPIFDGQDPTNNLRFSDCFTSFMARTQAGRAMQHIVPSPLFVDSSLTPGIQIADTFAYVTRMSYEHRLASGSVADPYLSAIQRYWNIVRSKTRDYERGAEYTWYGIATMDSSKFIFEAPAAPTDSQAAPVEAGEEAVTLSGNGEEPKPRPG